MNLWQKESNDATASYVNVFKENPSADFRNSYKEVISNLSAALELVVLSEVRPHRKNDASSVEYRKQGNIKFGNKKFLEAIHLYNESLCFAEAESENISLAYGNRSACFFELKKFEKSLVDIELAIEANYPSHLMAKLEKRRAACVTKIETNSSAEEFNPKLSYKESEKYPGMANVLKLQINEKFGRHIIANSDIPAGKTVFIEEAFLSRSVKMQYSSCTVCLKSSKNFIPCSVCSNALFCYGTCATTQNVHKMLCDYHFLDSESNKEFIIHSIMVAMSMFPNVDTLMEFVAESVKQNTKPVPDSFHDMKSKYRTFLRLNIVPGVKTADDNYRGAYKVYHDIMIRKPIGNQFKTKAQKQFLKHLILHHIFILNNSYQYDDNKNCSFIMTSYINHSCAPNVLFATNANQVVFITMRPIKAGEQLFQTYLGDVLNEAPWDAIEYRQQHLYDLFGFVCECERCRSNGKEIDWYDLTRNTEHEDVVIECKELLENPDLDKEKLLFLQEKCVDFLNRFGKMEWCYDLGMMMFCYARLYTKLFNAQI